MKMGVSSAHPSLALIKYWGKKDNIRNLPATPSLGVTLDGLTTRTRVDISSPTDDADTIDRVYLDDVLQDENRFALFFSEFRKIHREKKNRIEKFNITACSSSDFPASAGFASSSSGFAALSCACADAAGIALSTEELSALARLGSASAARSLYGGFTQLNAGSEYAEQIYSEKWWPDFRIIVLELEKEPKKISSRQAMEITRLSSPYYDNWLEDSTILMAQSLDALRLKDLNMLGPLIRKSYLRMFATMIASYPPIIYWKPVSLAVIQFCEIMRSEGLSVWETMDAGPQVKLFCLKDEVEAIRIRLNNEFDELHMKICIPGGPPLIHDENPE